MAFVFDGSVQRLAERVEALEVVDDNANILSYGSTTRRTLAVRFADVVNARDWGAILDGGTDDRWALAALSLYYPSAYKTLVIDGPCYVSSSISLGANLPVRFEGAGSFVGPGTVTYTRWLPEAASGTQGGIITTGAQTFAGVKTFQDGIALPAWTALTLLNSWTVYSGRTPGFLMDAFGFVHLRGVAVGGAAGSVMATLPVSRRPTMKQIFPVMTQLSTPPAVDGAVRGQVDTNGDITLAINPPSTWTTGTWVDLSTITFRAEQ